MKNNHNNKMWSTCAAGVAILGAGFAYRTFVAPDAGPRRARAAAPAGLSRAAAVGGSDVGTSGQSVDQNLRFTPTTRPYEPLPQHPPESTTQNTDTGKPPQEWQRLTDDWLGLRPKLDDKGITFQGTWAGYVGDNFQGGNITRHGGAASLLNVNLTLDSQKLLGYEGGTFFVNFRQQTGLQNSLDGSFSTTSHLDVPRRTEVSEIWYEQKAFDDKLRVRVGKIDVNTEFDAVDNSGEFLNGNFSASGTILGFPTDPDPAFGGDAFFYPTKNFYAGVGVYDGSLHDGVATGASGPFGKFHDLFVTAEVGATWTINGGRDGRVAVGFWHHTGTFQEFEGNKSNGATGPFATLDQVLWRANPEKDDDKRGIAGFALAGYGNPSVDPVSVQVGGGLKWTGLIASRQDDVIGVGANYLRFSTAQGSGFSRRDEVTVEGFYKARLNAWLSVEPDLQFVHNPGGNASRADSVSFAIQALVDF